MASGATASRTVVIAIDASEHAEYAWNFYLSDVNKKEDKIILVHAPEYTDLAHSIMGFADPMVVAELISKEREAVRKLTEKYSNKLKEAKLEGRLIQSSGKPAEAILNVVKKEKADLLVLGCRGMGKLRRTILGSTSDYCVHHVNIPVLVCLQRKNPQECEH